MKRAFLLLALTLQHSWLQAQDLGNASTESAKVAAENNWKNWAFAGGALALAAIAITLVAFNAGSSPQQH